MKSLISRLREETNGFTLPEVLVTIMMMVMVLFALYSIFDMGIRIFTLGNDKLEATQNARIGLEKMSREVRAAYPYDKTNVSTTDDHVFFSTSSPATPLLVGSTSYSFPQITFGNDGSTVGSSGHNRIECGGSVCEYVTYKLTARNNAATPCSSAPCSLRRDTTSSGSSETGTAGQAVVENVEPGGLKFQLLKDDGTPPNNESQVGLVRISLTIDVNGRDQKLSTDIHLRNRQ